MKGIWLNILSNVIIIGGGAAGMMSAVVAARKGHKVTIIEQQGRLGKKILSTGNGRCNFTNEVQTPECYHSSNPSFPFAVYEKFPLAETLSFFKTLGIYPKSRQGYIYPYSNQATAVVDVFTMELKRLNVKVLLETRCDEIIVNEGRFTVKITSLNDKTPMEASTEITGDKIIITSGGKAAPALGSDGSGYSLAKSLGHHLIPVLPALVQLRCEESFYKQIAGLRMDGKVSIVTEENGKSKTIAEDTGEIQLTNYGISGIPVFQVSGIAAKELAKGKKVKAVLDFMPHLSVTELEHMLIERFKNNPNKLMNEFLIGLFPRKFTDLLIKLCGFDQNHEVRKVISRKNNTHTLNVLDNLHDIDEFAQKTSALNILAHKIKGFNTRIIEPNSFEQAQVCSGGVDTREINPDTMESLLVKGIYFAGEIVDVDGICGGYNLQWAWSSAYVAGSSEYIIPKNQTSTNKYRISQVKLQIEHEFSDIKNKLMKQFELDSEEIISIDILKKSIDARKKPQLYYTYTLVIELLTKKNNLLSTPNVELYTQESYSLPFFGKNNVTQKNKAKRNRPIIVGTGPAGLFCGYILAKAGCKPILLERGTDVDRRILDVTTFWETGNLNLNSNVQFGEGGAGTFSDGKLNTLVKDKFGRNRFVLETLVDFGAPKEILYEQKPHVGTDKLISVVKNMRKAIEELGGEVLFNTQLVDVSIESNTRQLIGVSIYPHKTKQELFTDTLVLAIGHSARDTFEMLFSKSLQMSAKSFAVGFRIEHPQEMINQAQYGENYPSTLPAATYKLAEQLENSRGVYSFCMCPGGYVVNASSEKSALAINGMSYHKRDGKNANSAIVVTVTPDDFPSNHPLSGIEFQRILERKAHVIGEGRVPVQRFGDFLESDTLLDISKQRHLFEKELEHSTKPRNLTTNHEHGLNTIPSIKGDWQYANLNELFPPDILSSLKNGILKMDKKIKGFANPNALLSGVESRTSSPVKIHRDENYESNIKGIYPCGEGAGYAGGITSAAMDGMKVAEAILAWDKRADGINCS